MDKKPIQNNELRKKCENYVTDDLKMAMFCISDSKSTRTDILVFDFITFWF